ncbi:MAG: molybdate ABC transporter permease subunit [Halobacteriaceae archaeon]
MGRPDWVRVAILLGALLAIYYLVPLAALLLAQPPGTVLDQLGTPMVQRAAATSVAAATISTVVATVLGLPLAYWLARSDSPLTPVVTAIVVLPLVLPPIVSGMLLVSVFNPGAPVGGIAAAAGLRLTRSLAGVVLAQTFVASPFVVVTARAALADVDPALEGASRSLGKSHWTTLRRVTIPLAKPGIVAGVTLAFARSMGEFGATVMMAYYPRTLTVQTWVAFQSLGLDAAFPVAVVLLVASLSALAVLTILGTTPWDA